MGIKARRRLAYSWSCQLDLPHTQCSVLNRASERHLRATRRHANLLRNGSLYGHIYQSRDNTSRIPGWILHGTAMDCTKNGVYSTPMASTSSLDEYILPRGV